MTSTTRQQNRPRGAASRSRTAPSVVLALSPWWDPDLAVVGHDPCDEYTEIHWLPVLGPTALLALRWMSRSLKASPGGLEVPHVDFARAIGLGAKLASDSPAVRCLDRLCYFELARPTLQTTTGRGLQVRTHVPDLPGHLRSRLPRNLRDTARP